MDAAKCVSLKAVTAELMPANVVRAARVAIEMMNLRMMVSPKVRPGGPGDVTAHI